MRQMDSFRGSSPPKFISFYLGNQIPEDDAATNPEIISPPVSADSTIFDPETVADLLDSPRDADGEQNIEMAAEYSEHGVWWASTTTPGGTWGYI